MIKLESLDLVLGQIFRFVGKMGIVVITFMMLLIVTDVAGRYFFNIPIIGSIEITELLNIVLSFFALVWCTQDKEHLNVNILEKYIPLKIRHASDTIYYLLGVCLYFFICLQNVKIFKEYMIKDTKTVIVGIPLFPVYFVIALTCGCVAAILLLAAIKNIFSKVK